MFLWRFSELINMRAILRRVYRMRVEGAERIPASGGCIVVANHESLVDPWFLSVATPRRVRFMAKAELWKYPLLRQAMDAYGTFPVERGAGDTGAMRIAGELLDQGELLAMFPRGTSKPDGNRIWHRGAARLALAHGVPIVPVRLVNTRQLLPLRAITIHVGEPIVPAKARPTIGAAKALTAELEAAVGS
jgi:1-acyl-sn-glycerol-3-phosphate acyltransferase